MREHLRTHRQPGAVTKPRLNDRRWGRVSALAATALLGSTPLTALAQAQALSYPSPGVVCDPAGQTCYDNRGVSLPATRQVFGSYAVDRLNSQLAGRPLPSDFRLSTGAACSVPARLCWSDGWSRSRVDQPLTQQLFGGSFPPGPNNNQGFNPYPGPNNQGFNPNNQGFNPNNQGFNPNNQGFNPNNQGFNPNPYPGPGPYPRPTPVVTNDSGRCTLSRGGLIQYNGPCGLRKVMRENRSRYEVSLGNGSNYTFRDNNGQVTITDGSGNSWPVTAYQQGRSGVFQFADYRLVATRNGSPDGTINPGNAILGGLLGVGVGVMLNQLFQ